MVNQMKKDIMDKEEILNEYKKFYLNGDSIFNKLKTIHNVDKFTIADSIKKDSQVCFVFSCPGRAELIAGKPCQGATGDNLNILLKLLNEKLPDLFTSQNKEDYDIINATNVVHFYALDGRSEGTIAEIKNSSSKIKDYIRNNKNFKFAIICGEKAKKLKDLFNEKFIETKHLGFQSINQIEVDDDADDRTTARLRKLTDDILLKIKNKGFA